MLVSFGQQEYLEVGEQYAIVLQSSGLQHYSWITSDERYSRGTVLYKDVENTFGNWQAVFGCDFLFRTFMTPDSVAPTGSVAINGGKLRTSSRTVTLALNATDPSPGAGVKSMRIKNAGGSWTAWQPYADSKGWKLTRGAGKKTVYAQYRDAADNVSASASDSITYRP